MKLLVFVPFFTVVVVIVNSLNNMAEKRANIETLSLLAGICEMYHGGLKSINEKEMICSDGYVIDL